MKKLLAALLIFGMLLTNILAVGEEIFTLHNGVKFGMSVDEVKKTEASHGLQFEEEEKSNYSFPNIFRLKSDVVSVAGQDASIIYYFFNNNKELTTCVYSFDYFTGYFSEVVSIGNEKVLSALKSKYGMPDAQGDKVIDVGEAFDALDLYYHMNAPSGYYGGMKVRTDFNQWLKQIDNGYVDIMLITMIATTKSNSKDERRLISYTFRTNEEVEASITNATEKENKMLDDL